LAIGLAFDARFPGRVVGLPPSIADYIERHHDYWLNSQSLIPNAQLAGVGGVRSGETVFWDRPPGIMKIEVITEGGDQAFAPSFKIEPNKTYFVDYHYMSADFKLSEVK
jgi:hypothetical protein